MTFLAAAEAVLRSARRPLTTRELTEAAIRRGLLKPTGRTPFATMSAALYKALYADGNSAIKREFVAGPTRAARGSVRWTVDHS